MFKSFILKTIKNLNVGKLAPKLKSRQIYLKNCTLANLKVLNTNLVSDVKSKIFFKRICLSFSPVPKRKREERE